MKKHTIGCLLSFLLLIIQAKATDTLFYENFDSWNFVEIEDSIFTDYDEDGIAGTRVVDGNTYYEFYGWIWECEDYDKK